MIKGEMDIGYKALITLLAKSGIKRHELTDLGCL
jgi:hypothetical protein